MKSIKKYWRAQRNIWELYCGRKQSRYHFNLLTRLLIQHGHKIKQIHLKQIPDSLLCMSLYSAEQSLSAVVWKLETVAA